MLGMVAHTFYPSTQKEASRAQEFKVNLVYNSEL